MLMLWRVLLVVGGGGGPSVLQHVCRGEGGLQEEGMGLHGVERRAGEGQKQQMAVPCQADGAAARVVLVLMSALPCCLSACLCSARVSRALPGACWPTTARRAATCTAPSSSPR